MGYIIAPVTDSLRDQLVGTAEYVKMLEGLQPKDLNDREHFRPTVNQLESLAVATLEATAAAPMTGPKMLGARFRTGDGQNLDQCVASVVGYLRDNASKVLELPQASLHSYSTEHLGTALAYLRQLNGLLLSNIIRNAEKDLAAIRDISVDALLVIVGGMARATRGGDA